MKKLLAVLIILSAFIATGCRDKTSKASIRVMAAASMTEVFTDIKQQFEKKYPDVKVELNFAGSQRLAHQIQYGVYADVFASANKKYMELLKKENLIEKSEIIADNTLIIGIYSKNKNIKTLKDLVKNNVKLSIADISVPVGNYTNQMLDKIDKSNPGYKKKFMQNVVSNELNVKSAAIKIVLGEVDAGVIYKTDITSNIKPLEIDKKYNITAKYPIAVLKNSTQKINAQKFIDFVTSQNGQMILKKHGFILPND